MSTESKPETPGAEAREELHRAAVALERARCAAIMTCQAAEGRPVLARYLACETEMEPADAVKALLAAPLETLGATETAH